MALLARVRGSVAQIKRDFREPLEGQERLSRWQRLRLRTRRLLSMYGWKVVLGVFVYYLIRDLMLYVLVPYLALRLAW